LAYSLNDLYRPLRLVLRANGLLLGLGGGALLIFWPAVLMRLGLLPAEGPLWSVRLAGALLWTVGGHFLLAARERMVSTIAMITLFLANGSIAIVLMLSYLRGEFAGLGPLGQALLVLLFIFCLVCALVPLRFLRTDYVVL
jgi:hypothetical protein